MYKRLIKILSYVFVVTLIGLVSFHKASAMDEQSIKSKAMMEGVYQCLQKGAYNTTAGWKASEGGKKFLLIDVGADAVKLPYGLTDASNNDADCFQIMKGGGGIKTGLVPASALGNSADNVKKYFESIGYEVSNTKDATTGSRTQKLVLSISPNTSCYGSNGELQRAEFKINGSTTATSINFPTITIKDGASSWSNTIASGENVNVPMPGSFETYVYEICGANFTIEAQGSVNNVLYRISTNDNNTFPLIAKNGEYEARALGDKLAYNGSMYRDANGAERYNYVELSPAVSEGTVSSSDAGNFGDYNIKWPGGKSKMDMVKNINANNSAGYSVSGLQSNYNQLALTAQEVYDLYSYYLVDVYGIPVICEGDANYDLYENEPEINWKKGVKCKAFTKSPNATDPGVVYGVDASNHFTKAITLNDILNYFKKVDLNNVEKTNESGTISGGGVNGGNPDGGEGDGFEKCYDMGLDSMAWVLCPATSNLSRGLGLATTALDGLLATNTEFYGSGSAAETTWDSFRNIANIMMIIILIVVIFSQITGYGIDNYGIKKILPRLIAMAILINLSFFICQVLIDLSNVLGVGLNNLFATIGGTAGADSSPGWVSDIVVGLLAIAAAASAGATTGAMALSVGLGPMLIVVLLLALITAFVAALMFLITVGARAIIVVVFAAISPVAFALYILPNTQGLFKKWWDVFKTALVVYPICGGLCGVGVMIRGIVYNTAAAEGVMGGLMNIVYGAIAIMAPFVPFFAMPVLLKGALNKLGGLGGMISGFNSRVKSGVQLGKEAVQRSPAFKNAQEQKAWIRDIKRSGMQYDKNTVGGIKLDEKGNPIMKNRGKVRMALAGGKSGVAAATARALEGRKRSIGQDKLVGDGAGDYLAASLIAQQKQIESEDVANRMRLVDSETNGGANTKRLNDMFDSFMAKGDIAGAKAVIRTAGRRKDSAAAFMDHMLESGKYSSEQLARISKEIAEGETSGMFRQSDSFGFEYMSRLNSGSAYGPDGNTTAKNYDDWLNNQNNLHDALDKYVTTPSELFGMQGRNIEKLANLMDSGKVSANDVNRIRKVAKDGIKMAQDGKMELDTTKAKGIYHAAFGKDNYQDRMRTDGVDFSSSTSDTVTDEDSNTGGGSADVTGSMLNPDQLGDDYVRFMNNSRSGAGSRQSANPRTPEEVNVNVNGGGINREIIVEEGGMDVPHGNSGGRGSNRGGNSGRPEPKANPVAAGGSDSKGNVWPNDPWRSSGSKS